MVHDHCSSDAENQTGGVSIGDVDGDIRDSTIAGRDVNIARAEQVYIQAAKVEAPLTPEKRRELERLYLERVAEECRCLETEGMDRGRAELTDVFVMLEAVESPRRETESDVAPVPERVEEMGLKERAAALFGHHKAGREEQMVTALSEHREAEREERRPAPAPVPLSQALGADTHLLILGEPGTGKTTTLQFVALCFATKNWAKAKLDLDEAPVPVRMALREYDGEERLDRFIIRWLHRAYVPEPLALDWLAEGRLAILLDGLDEVPQARRATVTEAIERFAAIPEGRCCRIVVTSRIAGYREGRRLGVEFGQYTIRPFAGPRDAQPYIVGWLRALKSLTREVAEGEAKALLEAMEQQGGLRHVISNPLLLRLAVTVYAETGELAHSRAELYRRYVQEVTWERAKAREEPRWSYSQIAQALEILAWELQTGDKRTDVALAGAVESNVAGVVDGREVLDYLRGWLGLLAVYGYERGDLIAFRHMTFQEYFVAQRLERTWERSSKRAWHFLRPRLHHPAWREPLLLLGGMLDENRATELVRHTLKAQSSYERLLRRDLLLAASILVESGGSEEGLHHRIVVMLLRLFANAAKERSPGSTRAFSSGLQSKIDVLKRLRWLRQVLGHALIGLFKLYAVGKQVFDNSIAPLLRWRFRLLRRPNAGRYVLLQQRIDEALIALGRLRPEFIVADMADRLIGERTDQEEIVERGIWPQYSSHRGQSLGVMPRAAAILGQLGALEVLLKALSTGYERFSAAEELRRLKHTDPEVIDALIRIAENHNALAREAIAWILGPEDRSDAVNVLVNLLEDADIYVRRVAAESLSGYWSPPSDRKVVVALLQALERNRGGDLRLGYAIREALWNVMYYRGRHGYRPIVHGSSIRIGLASVKEADQMPFWNVIESLRREGPRSERAIAILTSIATSQDESSQSSDVQEVAIGLLGMIGAARPERLGSLVEVMLELLDDWRYRPVAPENAIVKLAESWPKKIVSILCEKEEPRILEKLVAADVPGALEALLNLLQSDDLNVRWEAIGALEWIEKDDPELITALFRALEDPDEDIRKMACWILGKKGMKTDAVISHLESALEGECAMYPHSPSEAAQMLWDLGMSNQEVVSKLTEWCVLYWDDKRSDAMEMLPQLLRANPELVASRLTEVVQSYKMEDATGLSLGARPKDRAKAAEAIGFLGIDTPCIRTALEEALLEDVQVGQSVVWALARIEKDNPSPEVINELLRILEDRQLTSEEDSSGCGRERRIEGAAQALGYLGTNRPDVESILLATLSSNIYDEVSRAAAVALGQLGVVSPLVIRHLIFIWGTKVEKKWGSLRAVDLYENGFAAMRRFAVEHPLRLRSALLAEAKEGSTKALRFLIEHMSDQLNVSKLQEIAWWLYIQIVCAERPAHSEYTSLDQVVARMTELEVAALDGGPPLFASPGRE